MILVEEFTCVIKALYFNNVYLNKLSTRKLKIFEICRKPMFKSRKLSNFYFFDRIKH